MELPIDPFETACIEIKLFCHFLMLKKILFFRAVFFDKSEQNLQYFMKF